MVDVLTPKQVHELLTSDEDVVVIDVLGAEYFRKQHLPKAINIPLEVLESIVTDVVEHHRTVVVYCYDKGCHASDQAAATLKEMGYDHVFDLAEGIEGYKQAGFSVTEYPH